MQTIVLLIRYNKMNISIGVTYWLSLRFLKIVSSPCLLASLRVFAIANFLDLDRLNLSVKVCRQHQTDSRNDAVTVTK